MKQARLIQVEALYLHLCMLCLSVKTCSLSMFHWTICLDCSGVKADQVLTSWNIYNYIDHAYIESHKAGLDFNCGEYSEVQVVRRLLLFFCCCCVVVAISWAAPAAYGSSQARGQIGAIAIGLRQRHSNSGSKPRLQSTPQFTETPDP